MPGNRQYWSAPATPLSWADGTPVTAAALTDASPVPQRWVNQQGLDLGTTIRMHAQGEYTSAGTTPTLTLGFYWGTPGAIGSATLIAATGALTIGTATAWPWQIDWEGEVRALGATGSVKGMGMITFANTASGLTADMPNFPMPTTAAARTVTVNLAVAQYMLIGCTWSSVTNTPSLTCHHATCEVLG